jgi:hypothetical protein
MANAAAALLCQTPTARQVPAEAIDEFAVAKAWGGTCDTTIVDIGEERLGMFRTERDQSC